MVTIMDSLKDYWPIVASLIALVVWLTRVESRTKTNTDSITRIERDIQHDREATESMLKEIRMDIKTLLRGGG